MNEKPRIIIAGGSGFIGRAIAEQLHHDYEIVVLSRSPSRDEPHARFVQWDGRSAGEWTSVLDGAAAVINLAGKHVSCRYTPENRREIDESRVNSVLAIAQAIGTCAHPPRVWIQASTTAIYGDAGERICDESAAPGEGFPVQTATLWERTFNQTHTPNTRRVVLRISFVLGRGGGVLQLLAKLTRAFLGGSVGSGRQCISWIHVDDLVRIIRSAIERDDMSGVYNATSPQAVKNRDFMRTLRRVLRRPWSPPAPAWAVKIGCWALRTEPVLALTGRRALPKRLEEIGFAFRHTDLEGALRSSISREGLPRAEACRVTTSRAGQAHAAK
jgi:uncharacterized protein (TIGR01777 family)